jgi:ribosome-binding factor A
MKQTAASHKINEAVRTAVAESLLLDVADPRLQMLTITQAEVSRDRSVANVYVAASKERYDEVEQGLASAKGRLRTLVGKKLGWKTTPQLHFFIDTGLDHASRIQEVLNQQPQAKSEEQDS